MECPKCHRIIADDATSCPYCHKVLSLVCPNCKMIGHSSVCENCGYIILDKCAKCGTVISSQSKKCKCGFPTITSIAYNECETDEFASIKIEFSALNAIRRLLSSKDLYIKFKTKLHNLLISQLQGFEGNVIFYGDVCVINFNKELSFTTSANKAIRMALKLINSFSSLNLKVQEELGTTLRLTLTITQKHADELLLNQTYKTNVKSLSVHKEKQKYLKGTQVILDEYVQDAIGKDYKTDSLYTVEKDLKTIVFYEVKLEKYVLPPETERENIPEAPELLNNKDISKNNSDETNEEKYIEDLNIFNINAKCKFEKVTAGELLVKLNNSKIISICGDEALKIKSSELVKFYTNKNKRVIRICITEENAYKPWGVMTEIFRQYNNLSVCNSLIPQDFKSNFFKDILNLINDIPKKALSAEDARYAYMDDFVKFLSVINNTVIIIEGFQFIDDTTLQTLELYFDDYKRIKSDFVFITNDEVPVHSKIKSLLNTNLYTELKLKKDKIESLVSEFQEDASDFLNSFYFEKIKNNFSGSRIYFDNAIKYLKEKGVLVSFENKLLVKNNDSVFLAAEIEELLKLRLKVLSKNTDASIILAYLAIINPRLDYEFLEKLDIKDLKKNVDILENAGFVYVYNSCIYLNNVSLVKNVILSGMKKNICEFLSKNILSKINEGLDNTTTLLLMGKLSLFKEEYLLLWKNAQFSIQTGDYDAYLKNTFGFMTLINYIKGSIPDDVIEENKKEVYKNILLSLYAYSPEKIYDIGQILLNDAVNNNDKENTLKLSNIMLQGALLSGKYGDALGYLNNILRNMENPKLIVSGAINAKFLLLSLVNIDISFNTGNLQNCIDISNELLSVLSPAIISEIKPASFSVSLFAEHLMDTFRMAALAHVFSLNDNLDEFLSKVSKSMGEELPDKDAIKCINEFLSGTDYIPNKVEEASPYSKVLYLILHELSSEKIDYKNFAQNIYQAKLLASEIHQTFLVLLCELLIAYAYSKARVYKKSRKIYKDIIDKSEKAANVNIYLLAKYFYAIQKIDKGELEGGLLLISDSVSFISNTASDENLLMVLFKKLMLNTALTNNISYIDTQDEEYKLKQFNKNGKINRLLKEEDIEPLVIDEDSSA